MTIEALRELAAERRRVREEGTGADRGGASLFSRVPRRDELQRDDDETGAGRRAIARSRRAVPRVCDFGGRPASARTTTIRLVRYVPEREFEREFFWKYENQLLPNPLSTSTPTTKRGSRHAARERHPTGRHQNPRREHVRRPRREGDPRRRRRGSKERRPRGSRERVAKPQRRALFSGAGRRPEPRGRRGRRRARARGAAGSDPRRTFPDARIAPLSRDPRRVPDAARARPRSTSTTPPRVRAPTRTTTRPGPCAI